MEITPGQLVELSTYLGTTFNVSFRVGLTVRHHCVFIRECSAFEQQKRRLDAEWAECFKKLESEHRV
jgi:hypothetical protein